MKTPTMAARALAVAVSLPIIVANAAAQVTIETTVGGNTETSAFEGFIQTWVNFFSGPFAAAAIFGGIVIGAILFALAPRAGGLLWVVRAVAAGLIIVAAGGFLTTIGLFN